MLHTTVCTCSNESTETEQSIYGTEASWKLKAHPTALSVHVVSHLMHLAWENVIMNVTRSLRACSYLHRPPTSYTVSVISRCTVDWTTGRS